MKQTVAELAQTLKNAVAGEGRLSMWSLLGWARVPRARRCTSFAA